MPQNPPMPLQFLILDPIITTIRLCDSVLQALIILDRWILALIVYHEIAWAICIMWLAIGEATKAPWRLQMEETGDHRGDRAFLVATLTVFSLWAGILSIIVICEFFGFLVWGFVYFVAIRFGARQPRLLPLIERAWLAAGYDLVSTWRTHYR